MTSVSISMGNHNVLAVFPYWQSSLDVDEFKYELFMIRDWFRAFDADQADVKGVNPTDSGAYPARVAIVTHPFHQSSYTPNERDHITILVATDEGWRNTPRETRGCAHIYAVNDKVEQGFGSWYMQLMRKKKLSSATIIDKIENALQNPLQPLR